MKKSSFPNRFWGSVGLVVVVLLMAIGPVAALAPQNLQVTGEPTPRDTATSQPSPTITPTFTVTPSPTPVPYIMVEPTRTAGTVKVTIKVIGYRWPTAGPGITLYWDAIGGDGYLDGPFPPNDGGYFERMVTIAKDKATVGTHRIIAGDNRGFTAAANVELFEPTAAPPATSTPTFTPSPTVSPSPTLRPVTPMVTITPIPPTRAPVQPTQRPAATWTSAPPATWTSSPADALPTSTLAPTWTLTPSQTPGPGTPSATPRPTESPTVTPSPTASPTETPPAAYDEEIADTGLGSGMLLLGGGLALAALVVAVRQIRVKGLAR